ncbi:hypothetical protein H4R18_002936 [Coemansia javaensis]|uniref:Uncharacterized protein n=1 Tax=Coemansia javaensis TaxID=2761396 RepID=A0A9W8HDF4_9FUNG|nr:hypothetical protein H4R18_002936 [Coemansia javaensis]
MTRLLGRAILLAALLCQARPVHADVALPAAMRPFEAGAEQEHEYHLWDALTSRAAEYVAPITEGAGEILGGARRSDAEKEQPGGQLRAGLEKLGNMVGTLGRGASPSWPEAVFDETRDPAFAKYIQDLGHASKQAHAHVQSRLDAHSAMLKMTAPHGAIAQLPLARCYAPVLALLLALVASQIRPRPAAAAAASGRGDRGTRAAQQDRALGPDRTRSACALLMLVPMSVVQLVVMELGGVAGWLVAAGYALLVVCAVAATGPSLLARSAGGDAVARAAHCLTVAATAAIAGCCIAHSVLAFYA